MKNLSSGCLCLLFVQYITQQLRGVLFSAVHYRFSLCIHLKMRLLFTSLETVDLRSEANYLGHVTKGYMKNQPPQTMLKMIKKAVRDTFRDFDEKTHQGKQTNKIF